MSRPGRLPHLLSLAALIGVFGCKPRSAADSSLLGDASASGRTGAGAQRPWEIVSNKGEAFLPDIFYAEPLQNEQVMPTKLFLPERNLSDPHPCSVNCYQINHLIYPTIGNPNLYVRDEDGDELMVVLRLEDELLTPYVHPGAERVDALTMKAEATADAKNGIKFFLVDQTRRLGWTDGRGSLASLSEPEPEPGIYPVTASALQVRDKVGVAELDKRTTVQARFDRAALAAVPAGLYDLRMEILKDGMPQRSTAVDFEGYEYQYNAVRIFDKGPGEGDYWVVNVTDSQVSVSDLFEGVTSSVGHKMSYKTMTHDKLINWVNYINKQWDYAGQAEIRDAAFVTFNGDLHNGGSPASVTPFQVAWTYNYEARAIVSILKTLRLPIFLTPGNHDGYVSMGHAPDIARNNTGPASVEAVVNQANPAAWSKFSAYLAKTASQPGGYHNDIFTGKFVRRGKLAPTHGEAADAAVAVQSAKMADSWQRIAPDKENMVFYDGFNQWRQSYGPLYASWNFGKNHYVNINTFDLRQHRRTGWGMYTVNYGGNISQPQMDWIKTDLAAHGSDDVIIIAHHDPRGGHGGKDYPYMFRQIDYNGMSESAVNYIDGKEISPTLCAALPSWARSATLQTSCLHDGLQEWMMADPEFDCDDLYFDQTTGFCKVGSGDQGGHPRYSAFQMLHRLTTTPNIRTVLLGHTHWNSLEVKQAGEELVETKFLMDPATLERIAAVESADPIRAATRSSDKRSGFLPVLKNLLVADVTQTYQKDPVLHDLSERGHDFQNRVQGTDRELAILRLTTVAQLSSQVHTRPVKPNTSLNPFASDVVYQTRMDMGFSTFRIGKATSLESGRLGYPLPQLNEIHYFVATDTGDFEKVLRVDLARKNSISATSDHNPLYDNFKMK